MEKFSRFLWIKDFVFSNELEQEVALAGISDTEFALIDVFGNVLETLTNE